MDPETLRRSIAERGNESFTRSAGPGGQNVNKTSTAIVLHVEIAALEGLSDEEKSRAAERLAGRINSRGELVVRSQETRSQLENRALALERAFDLVSGALKRQKPRRATKPTKASKERRLHGKRLSGIKKKDRNYKGDE